MLRRDHMVEIRNIASTYELKLKETEIEVHRQGSINKN